MPQESQNIFSGLLLWQYFEKNATTQQVVLVEKHIEAVMPLMDYYIKTFPTYTLHNGQHQRNIISIMGNLLGKEIEKLTTLEAGILILAAVYHDVGMVFKEDELVAVANEENFTRFLELTPGAKLKFITGGKVADRELIEWYCRAVHAERVWKYLDVYDGLYPLIWDGIPFKNELAYVCESHNWSALALKTDERLKTCFLGKCDLLFCSIILRMADILDFDNTRSPLSVYEYLGLDKPRNTIESVSKSEWQKHIFSTGFQFNHENKDLSLSFSAAPKHPEIEAGIRKFIDVIKLEMAACKALLRFCSDRWLDFFLPGEINTENIISHNYSSGTYHFSLSESKVLDLLTGEGLYKDEYIFIRELLQNAIDTTRHRTFVEKTSQANFQPQPIEVSYFMDIEGYHWIRIDDYGMGMNENIIKAHLLKKGESYYTSEKFKLEQLTIINATHHEFIPISRFGIGLLSCFMASDRIEISTKHVSEPGNAHRLTLQGRDGYFVHQSSNMHHVPAPMPAEYSFEKHYRKDAGTSIAVRINNNKEFAGFDFKNQLEEYVLCSPVMIQYKKKVVGGTWGDLLERPWTNDHTVEIDDTFVKEVEATFNIKLPKGIKLVVRNINISDYALDSDIKGQFIFIKVDLGEEITYPSLPDFQLSTHVKSIVLRVSKKVKREGKDQDVTLEHKNESLIESFSIPEKITSQSYFSNREFMFHGFVLSHNGIPIHDIKDFFTLKDSEKTFPSRFRDGGSIYCGILYFQDKLLPSLTISRNEIRIVPYKVYINTLLALKPLNEFTSYVNKKYDFFDDRLNHTEYSRQTIQTTLVYENNKEFWNNEPLYFLDDRMLSINNINEEIATRQFSFVNSTFYTNRIFNNFALYILEENFDIAIHVENLQKFQGYYSEHIIREKQHSLPQELSRFRPFTFFRFEGMTSKIAVGHFININHPLIEWYIKSSDYLSSEFTYYAWQLIYLLEGGFDKDKVKALNNILERLRHVMLAESKPGLDLDLTEKDF